MSDLTLPGTIPGLLRHCSPVRVTPPPESKIAPFAGVIGELLDNAARLWMPSEAWDHDIDATDDEREVYHFDWLALDLTDPTGRWHAVLWADSQPWDRLTPEEVTELAALYGSATTDNYEDGEAERIRDLCLKLAA